MGAPQVPDGRDELEEGAERLPFRSFALDLALATASVALFAFSILMYRVQLIADARVQLIAFMCIAALLVLLKLGQFVDRLFSDSYDIDGWE